MANSKVQSVEPDVALLANGWLKEYGLDYRIEQASLNNEIDNALEEYASKSGGSGGNRPDAKLLLRDSNMADWPILIEYKGYRDKFIKLDADGQIDNRNRKTNEPNYKVIKDYAVNGAIHYANALLHYTSYTDIISIGMTGWKDNEGNLNHKIGVYYVSKDNLGMGQEVDTYTDLSFLRPENFGRFIDKVKTLSLSEEELASAKEKREQEINVSLVKLNNEIYKNEDGISEKDRVYLVAAAIMATLGIPGKVKALEKSDLTSEYERGNRDGDKILRKINAFLDEKKIPKEKQDMIIRTLQNTLTTDNINKPLNDIGVIR